MELGGDNGYSRWWVDVRQSIDLNIETEVWVGRHRYHSKLNCTRKSFFSLSLIFLFDSLFVVAAKQWLAINSKKQIDKN